MRRTVLGLLLGLFTSATACGDGSLDPLPLSIALEASRTTAPPGQLVTFVVNAQGGNLLGVTIDYGDDSGDQLPTAGARTAHHSFSHAFSVAGVYQVRATVVDAAAGSKHADVQITVP
jgi:plastocyanin